MHTLTLEGAKQAKENNSLMQWAIDFMSNDSNEGFTKELKENNDETWVELIEFPLNKLKRITGPKEENLKWKEKKEEWEERVNSLLNDIQKNNYIPCPLIVTDSWDFIHISDGCHRHEALLRNKVNKYWVIFIIKDKNNIAWVLNNK